MSVIKADKGRVLLDFSWRGQRCREYLGLNDTKEGRAQARQVKLQVDAAIARDALDYPKWFPRSKKAQPGGVFAPPAPPPAPEGPPPLGRFAREWLTLQRPFGSQAHHHDRLSLLETHVIPFFGEERRLSDVSIEDVERFIGYLKTRPGLKGAHLSGVRINKARNLLRQLLDRAVKNGWLTANPVAEVRRLREDPSEIDPLSWKEVGLLLDKGFPHDPESQRFYTLKVFTGLRDSELIGAKWSDVDWTSDPPMLHVKRSFTKADGEHLTKTAGSARAIDLRPQAVAALKAQQTASRLKSEYLFCNRLGGPLDRDNQVRRIWYPSLRRAGLRARKPYQTRHTFASLALSAGEEIGWVARQLGHTNTSMVIKHYYKWVRNNTRQDGAAFDKAAAGFGL